MHQRVPKLGSLVFLLLLLIPVSAQVPGGRISGQVTDQQGAVVRGATVQVIGLDNTLRRNTKTDDTGNYSVAHLSMGTYQVIVQAPGFGSAASSSLKLGTSQEVVFNAQLSIEAAKSEIVVSAGQASTTLDQDTPSLATTLSSEEVTHYGLNGRNFSQLITLAPGVSNQTGQDEAKVGVAGSAKFSVNGGRVEYNTFEVDGSDVLNTSINASRGQGEPLVVYPSVDAIQEIKVLTANYSAMYGKSASGSVLVTTKSGGPQFHGNFYGFIRNEMFNARNYFDPVFPNVNGQIVKRTPLYRRQDYGGTIGGPLYIPGVYNAKKDKTYFFFSEELRLEKTPVDYNQAVPTASERQGDFTDVCPTPVPGNGDPLNLSLNPDCPHTAGATSPSRTIIPNYTSQAILQTGIIPQANSETGCNTTNPTGQERCYIATVSPSTYFREELFRIDHNLTSKQLISFRYIHDAWNTTTLTPQWGLVLNSFPTVENFLNGPGLDMVVNLTQTLPHGFLNRIGLGYSVEHITLTPQPGPGASTIDRPTMLDNPGSWLNWTQMANNPYCGFVTGPLPSQQFPPQTITGCAMGYIFNNGYGGNKMPGLVFQGTNGAYGGHGFSVDTGYAPWRQDNPTFDIRDDAYKALGPHTLQFGVQAFYVQQNELSAISGADSGDLQGIMTFSNQQSLYTSGNAFADFLAGPGLEPLSCGNLQDPSSPPCTSDYKFLVGGYSQTAIKSYTQDSGQTKYYNRYKSADFYLQDDWKVNSRLTINVGFRASLLGAWYNAKGTAYNWTPQAYSPSTGNSIYVDPTYGEIVRKTSGTPVPLNRSGPYSLNNLDSSITNGLTQCGVNGIPSSCLKNRLFHPAPRVGFSWSPLANGKLVLRAGYGVFWEHGTGNEANAGALIGSAPTVLSETQSNLGGGGPEQLNVGAYNEIGLSCQGGATQCGTLPSPTAGVSFPLNVTSIPSKAVYTYTQQWSLSVERELRKDTVAQLAYVGAKGTHLSAVSDLNQLQPIGSSNPFLPGQPITANFCNSGAVSPYIFSTSGTNPAPPGNQNIPSSNGIAPGSPGYINAEIACTGNPGYFANTNTQNQAQGVSPNSLRRYVGFANIIGIADIADSEYEALQGSLRETTGPVTIGVAYTYSHSIDDSSDRSSANFANSLDIHANRASSDFDERHMLNVSYLYQLPFVRLLNGFAHLLGNGRDPDDDTISTPAQGATGRSADQSSKALKAILGNWQLSGITTYQTGTPFSVVNGGGSNGTGAADNAGVGDGLGIGSYVDVVGSAHGPKPNVATGSNIGPLLLNPGAFAAPEGLTFGNSGRNYLNNPSRINFNMSLLKTFKAANERLNFEFHAEAFNVFNHTQFRIYDPANPGNTGNNVVNCYGGIASGYSAAGGDGIDCLTGNSFLHPVDAHDPRILQFALKMAF